MKNYCFTLLLLAFLLAFGCSDKKSPPAKTNDLQKSIAAPTASKTENESIKKQESQTKTAQKQPSTSVQPHISGVSPRISGAPVTHISGINHVSGQPRYSPNISGSQLHVSGRVVHPHLSGQ